MEVRASSVAGDDWHLMRGFPYVARMATGLRWPRNKIPGADVAGVVKAVGTNVSELREGDEVFGWCDGAFAEFAAVPAENLITKPANLSIEKSAAVPVCGFTALQAVRDKGGARPGSRVLVIGASGGVGTLAVQFAKALGANVTGVCGAAAAKLVESIGADQVIDYHSEDFAESDAVYDVIIDLVGGRSLRDTRSVLAADGTLVMVGGTGGKWFKGTDRFLEGLVLSMFTRHRLRPLVHEDSRADLITIKSMIEAGEVAPVISEVVRLADVPDAIGRLDGGHGRGKIVVAIP